MKIPHILLAEDEPFLGKVVRESLEKEGYQVSLAADGKEAWELFSKGGFSACILDVMMPYTDGFTLAAKIRKANAGIPLMFLTAKSDVRDIKEGYASGGNDYLKKPFSLDELFLRLAELLRRNGLDAKVSDDMPVGSYIFCEKRQELKHSGAVVKLSHKEAGLLALLLLNRNNVLERKAALIKLWGDDSYFNTRNMDVYITKLRNKLKADTSVEIVNVRGFGYKLIC